MKKYNLLSHTTVQLPLHTDKCSSNKFRALKVGTPLKYQTIKTRLNNVVTPEFCNKSKIEDRDPEPICFFVLNSQIAQHT